MCVLCFYMPVLFIFHNRIPSVQVSDTRDDEQRTKADYQKIISHIPHLLDERLHFLLRFKKNTGENFIFTIRFVFCYEINRIMSNIKQIKPTESELEILQVLWDKGNATVREVHEELSAYKDSGYTTTLKLMQIMFEKGLVRRDDSNKTHVYTPNVSKEKTQQQLVGKMVDSLFGGSASQLVMQALGTSQPSKEELDEIQKLLNDLKKQ